MPPMSSSFGSSMMTESDMTSPTSTTPSSTEFGASGPKKPDKTSYRKSSKPMMERKRRARINNCLSQLKSLVLQAMKKDNSQYSKLEKADILELTVKHLKHVQRIQAPNTTQIPEALSKYRAGFNECANEVMRYLGETQGVNSEARTRILSHLSTILSPVNTLPIQQPSHAHILPAPPAQSQQQHPLQPSQHQQQQQQKAHHLLQQQQELLQHTLQNNIVQQNQQRVPGFLGQPPEPPSIIPDYNNNNTSSMNSSLKRNYSNSNPANKSKDLNPLLSSSSGQISRGIVSKPDIIKQQTVSDSNNLAFQTFNVTTGAPSLHLPCIATPTAMATAPFQLVHSTLPNGQVALVLAPQSVPAMNVYTHNPSSLTPQEIAVSVLANQQMKQHQEQQQSLKQPSLQLQEELLRPKRTISPFTSRLIPQDAPIALVNKQINTTNNNNSDIKPDIEALTNVDVRLPQPSAFRLPTSSPATNPVSSSPKTSTFSSSSTFIPSSVIKVAKSQMNDITPADSIVSRSSPNHGAILSRSPPRKVVDNVVVSAPEPPKVRTVVRSPENVTSVRELFEYKMGKRRTELTNVNSANPTWRPW